MLSDLRFAARALLKTPGFTASTVLILAIAIAGNTAVFSAVDVLLIQPSPFRDPGRLLVIGSQQRSTNARAPVSFPDYREWTDQMAGFDGTAAVELEQTFNVAGVADPMRVTGARMTASLLPLLGVTPLRGRRLLPEDERPGAPPVVLITEQYWATAFQRAEDVVGRVISVDGVRASIVGVLPADFRLLYGGYRVWTPLRQDPTVTDRRHRSLLMLARLGPGVTLERSRAELSAITARLESDDPESNRGWSARILTMRDFVLAGRQQQLSFLLTALGLLLLVACTNVGSLQLARAAARHKEIAVRLALGAPRSRIVRLLLVEAGLVAGVSGALALLLVAAARGILRTSSPDLRELVISLPVLGYTLTLVLVTAVAFGLVPALTGTRVEPAAVMQGVGATRRSMRWLRSGLVVMELAVSLVLLVPTGLLFKSFLALRQMQPGFRVANVLTFSLSLPVEKYREPERQAAFYLNALERLAALPGIQAAAAADALPLHPPPLVDLQRGPDAVPGTKDAPESRALARASLRSITPSYFHTFDIALQGGRAFTDADDAAAPAVAIVNETLAAAIRSDRRVVGETVTADGIGALTIIGVAADMRSLGLRTSPQPELMVPLAQQPRAAIAVALRTAGDPLLHAAATRELVRGLDPDLPLAFVRPMAEIVDEQVAALRAVATLLGVLATLALVLAGAGLSGIMAWLVNQRTREIGVRAALGASPRDLFVLGMRHAVVLVGVGVALGLPLAVVVARLVSSQLWGVSETDPTIFIAVPCILAVTGLAASYGPSRRAAGMNPVTALRAG